MPAASRSRTWRIGLLGAVAFLLAAILGRTRTENEIAAEATVHRGPTDTVQSSPPQMGMVIAAAALCIALAGGTVAYLQITQMLEDTRVARALTGGEPARAAELVTRYGCGGCHTIPALPGANGQVAPQLSGLRQRVYIAGVVQNTPDNLIQWIVDPRSLSPRTAMPVTGISRKEAADVAAYLYAH
jgi:cytochrome c2